MPSVEPADFAVAFTAFIVAVIVLFGRRRRQRTVLAPLDGSARETLKRRLPWLRLLDGAQRVQHERRVREFLHDIRFRGCNGLEVTDEMRVLIAGMACLLLLRPEALTFRGLRSVLVYPTAFWVRHQEPDELGLVDDEPHLRVGESWGGERVILSWDDVKAALAGNPVNVLVHEFAHQLDDENPGSPGAPKLADYGKWSKVMQEEFDRLGQKRSPVLDDYGLEGPQEFFAVTTEAFFQSGAELERHHPKLYALLRDYYGFDTAALTIQGPSAP
jgi:Mlc titration factor MtfA (ptsG expression regulator)